MQISLIPMKGGEPVVLTVPLILVGRAEDCDLQLEEDGIADLHCVLALADNLLLLRDLNTGSVRVNGTRCRRAALLPNDVLTIASCRFRVEYQDERPEPGSCNCREGPNR